MLEYLKELSYEYKMSFDDVVAIALNRYGVVCSDTQDNRLRFNLDFLNGQKRFFAVCVNTYSSSPFKLSIKDNMLYLDDQEFLRVSNIEKDTCTATYFRNDKKVITFNSNSRSNCVGCKFCGTYSLSNDDKLDFTNAKNIEKYLHNLLNENGKKDMSDMIDITICTGCFMSEDALIKHLRDVNEATYNLGFKGNISYIGSQLRDYEKISKLAKEIPTLRLYLTIEKFLEREKFMRKEKASLTLDKCKELLEFTTGIGIESTFLYILGLEDLNVVEKYMNYFKESINKFPIIQVFQDYTNEQENYRVNDASDVRYYLEARKRIKEIFSDTNLVPNSWECFRSLNFDTDKVRIRK